MATTLTSRDKWGTVGARSGILRNSYKVTPGLYTIGEPDKNSPVVVTANYKLTFDTLRTELKSHNVWLLVVDTRGINVWCAAGKGSFSTEEIAYQVKRCQLSKIVSHRNLILPQLGATGVAALKLKKECGFRGQYGPVRAADLPEYLNNDQCADEIMRSVSFTLEERLVLIPVEVVLLYKQLLIALAMIFPVSGISPSLYSFSDAISRGSWFLFATILAIVAGAVITPLCLPWLPFRQFWIKGLFAAVPVIFLMILSTSYGGFDSTSSLALYLWIAGVGSYLAMNFTGSTPYTSLSGVEKEMRRGLVVQVSLIVIALVIWVASPFI